MPSELKNIIGKELCPRDMWQFSDLMETVLKRHMSRLPKGEVSKTETRYPSSPAGMRAFLEVFFARHYFQTQNSLLSYMTSEEFLDILELGKIRILDIGCGSAVGSLAVTDMLGCILQCLKNKGIRQQDRPIKITYVLNDTCGFCLGVGQHMLTDYFNVSKRHRRSIVHERTITVPKAFPENMKQLKRIKANLGSYDIAIFSYVVIPLNEEQGFRQFTAGILDVEELCTPIGRILILQDKFRAVLLRRIGKAIGSTFNKMVLEQVVYPRRNTKATHTYTYYACLKAPSASGALKQGYAV